MDKSEQQEDKKHRILSQAKIEFANFLYEDASINRIIKAINMPRGTFYLYFKNKEELYFYVLEDLHNKAKILFKDVANANNKDIKLIMIDLFDKTQNIEVSKIIKNIFINFNTTHFEKFLPLKPEFEQLFTCINFSKYNVSEEEKFILVHILQTILIQSISLSLKKPETNYRVREFMIKEIDFILKGKER